MRMVDVEAVLKSCELARAAVVLQPRVNPDIYAMQARRAHARLVVDRRTPDHMSVSPALFP
jgi:hypothetical protein